MTPCKPNYNLLCISNKLFLHFFLFLAVGKEVEEHRDILWEEVGCVGVTRPAL
jgi:hypothetical protein